MGQIIKQPDGKLCMWSSTVDDFILMNATPEEIVEFELGVARERIEREVGRVIGMLETGGAPYYQFTKTFEEAERRAREVHDKNREFEACNEHGAVWCRLQKDGTHVPLEP